MKSEIKQIKKVKLLSLAKIFAVLGVVMGLFFGIMISVSYYSNPITFSEAIASIQSSPENVVSFFFLGLGYWSILIAPILFGIFQFIYGAIIALVYNLIARFVGGVKVVLE